MHQGRQDLPGRDYVVQEAYPMNRTANHVTRRHFLQSAGGLAVAASPLVAPFAIAQKSRLRVGLMLPYTGTFAALGNAITNAFKLYVAESGGKLGGRELE